jgi:hypothetical protein
MILVNSADAILRNDAHNVLNATLDGFPILL